MVFCVWAIDNYYPTGADDLKGVYASEDDARAAAAAIARGDVDGCTWDRVFYTCVEVE